MKVAIFLTGLIQNRVDVLPHVKKMFDIIGEKFGVEFDYYCHFWNSKNKYPYYVIDEPLLKKLPTECIQSVDRAKFVLNPIQCITSSYDETLNSYRNSCTIRHNHPLQFSLDSIGGDPHYEDFFNQTIHELFFNRYEKPVDALLTWIKLHADWCLFIQISNQVHSAVKCLRMIYDTGNYYDSILKWRYDLLFDYINFGNTLVDAFKYARDLGGFHTEIAWEKLGLINFNQYEKVEDIPKHSDKPVSLGDVWWVTNYTDGEILKNLLYECYVSSALYGMNGIIGGQHTWLYDAIGRKIDMNIHLHGKINEGIIRFPDTIPLNFHENTDIQYINDRNIKIQPKGDNQKLMHDISFEQFQENVKQYFKIN